MSNLIWHESDDFKHDKFQAYYDFEHDHNKSNYKNACKQSFVTAWAHQQLKIEQLKKQLKEANEVIDHCENILVKNHACNLNTAGNPIKEYKKKYNR